MKSVAMLISGLAILLSCNKDEGLEINEQDFLIFGHFYGECIGEGCVEIFKLTDKGVFEDTVDDYSGENLEFVPLESGLFDEVRDLQDYFPVQLLSERKEVFGCPDCADGGGLHIQYSNYGIVSRWRIDQMKDNVPTYLHDFMDKVNEKIALIHERTE
ncbi:hypothetical protein [Pareuzebyella sediminis]|uniref:hypothetical protein n=1 Tax=Pareuzebyella sediminis TaxID=2607998 RepID=UPI0011EC6AF3|nr:hypothetical protein [Pareuzebyella sediminis]